MEKKTVELTDGNFEEQALRQDGRPVLVDFWATWCAPCHTMDPILDAVATELEGRVLVGKVNVDEQPGLAAAARIQAVPTLVLLKNGKVRDVMMGVQNKRGLVDKIQGLLDEPAEEHAVIN